ncbi:MAG: hypothetical protein WBW73_08485 [Rhodoplanes sp.]
MAAEKWVPEAVVSHAMRSPGDWRRGFLGTTVPEDRGGLGRDAVSLAVALEKYRGRPPLARRL